MNDVTLGDSHPATEELKPIKVGGKSTAIETAQHGNGVRINGDLEVTGTAPSDDTKLPLAGGTMTGDLGMGSADITASDGFTIDVGGDMTLDVAGSEVYIKTTGSKFAEISNSGTRNLTLYEAAGSTDDYFKIGTTSSGATVISTVDDAGEDGILLLDIDGDIALDSHTGNFIAKKAGTEFSVANSAYAGMILGYRCIGEDATPATFTLTTSMVTIHSDATVRFIAPPSGKVEVNFQAHYYGGNGSTVTLGISDNATYSALSAPSAQYEKVSFDVSRFDDAILNQNWVITGLTAGDTYNYWIGAKTSSTSGPPTIKYGGDSAGENVPLIIKVTALPAAVSDFAVYG